MDWTGNAHSIYTTLGASNHTGRERAEHDYYATEPRAADFLCDIEELSHKIWEPACGEGHLSKVLFARGHDVLSTDIVDRGFGSVCDFLASVRIFPGDIVTNPPYKYAQEFVEHALECVHDGSKVCMFLKLTFLEGKKRQRLFLENPPVRVWVSSSRLKCAMNGDFDAIGSSAAAYAWFVWEKGYKGDTTIKWFN